MNPLDEKYGPRESARFKGLALLALNNACKIFGVTNKSDILRSGPEAMIIIHNLQLTLSKAQRQLSTYQGELSEMKALVDHFLSNIHPDGSSIKSLSSECQTNGDRRRNLVGQRPMERRISCAI